MKILALDLATNTGVAFGHSHSNPQFWSERFGDAGTHHGFHFSQALDFTNRVIRKYQPDIIVIEQAIAGGAKGDRTRVELAMGLRACVLGVARMRGRKPPLEYPVQTIRKYFIGHGNLASAKAKAETIARCKRLGWMVANDNEADACAVWAYARSRIANIHTTPNGGFL